MIFRAWVTDNVALLKGVIKYYENRKKSWQVPMVAKSKEMYSECDAIHGQINRKWWKYIVTQFVRHDCFITEKIVKQVVMISKFII